MDSPYFGGTASVLTTGDGGASATLHWPGQRPGLKIKSANPRSWKPYRHCVLLPGCSW